MKAIRGFLISQIGSILGSVVTDYVLSWYITIESGSGQLWAFAWGHGPAGRGSRDPESLCSLLATVHRVTVKDAGPPSILPTHFKVFLISEFSAPVC